MPTLKQDTAAGGGNTDYDSISTPEEIAQISLEPVLSEENEVSFNRLLYQRSSED